MLHLSKHVLLVIGVTALVNVGESADWNYDFTSEYGPFHWADLYQDCGGITQSPINIHKNTQDGFSAFSSELSNYGVGTNENDKTFLDVWDWNEEFVHHFSITNNGHSVVFVPIDNGLNELRTKENGHIAKLSNVFGTSDTQEFCLDSFHFHWGKFNSDGSEHTQYGIQYPAEIHFVHYSCDFNSLSEAVANVNQTDGYTLAIVAFMFETDNDATDYETSVWLELMQDIDEISEEGDNTIIPNLNLLGSVLPSEMEMLSTNNYDRSISNLWTYEGSLTTPGCDPIVRWHVFDHKLKIKESHLEGLRNLENEDGKISHNARPTQNNINPVYQFHFADSQKHDSNGKNCVCAKEPIATTETSQLQNGNGRDLLGNTGYNDSEDYYVTLCQYNETSESSCNDAIVATYQEKLELVIAAVSRSTGDYLPLSEVNDGGNEHYNLLCTRDDKNYIYDVIVGSWLLYRRPKTLNKLQLKPISKQDNVFKVYYDELHIHFSKDKCLRLQCFDLLLVDIDDLDCSYRFHNFCEHFCQCEYGTSTNKSSQERVTSISDDSEVVYVELQVKKKKKSYKGALASPLLERERENATSFIRDMTARQSMANTMIRKMKKTIDLADEVAAARPMFSSVKMTISDKDLSITSKETEIDFAQTWGDLGSQDAPNFDDESKQKETMNINHFDGDTLKDKALRQQQEDLATVSTGAAKWGEEKKVMEKRVGGTKWYQIKDTTYLMDAAMNGNNLLVKKLCDIKDLFIVEPVSETNKSALDYAAYFGETTAFQIILKTIIDRNDIQTWNDWVEKVTELKVVSNIDKENYDDREKMDLRWEIKKWLIRAKRAKYDRMYRFLQQIEKAVLDEKFELLVSRLDYNEVFDAGKQEMIKASDENKRIKRIVEDLRSYCDEQVLKQLANCIKEMIEDKKMVNDTILMIFAEINRDLFEETLINTVRYCFKHDNMRDFTWFKQCISNSSLLAKSSVAKQNDGKYLLFNRICDECIEPHLNKQRRFIKHEMKKNWKGLVKIINLKFDGIGKPNSLRQYNVRLDYSQSNNNNKNMNSQAPMGKHDGKRLQWCIEFGRAVLGPKQIILNATTSDDVMLNGVQPRYNSKSLIKDYQTGFDASYDYDFNSYICNVIIVASKLNPIFQKECKKLLSIGHLGVPCKYKAAPIKTKERCQVKAALDYSDREWPYTSYIVDIIRCSVIFNDPYDFIAGLHKFVQIIEQNHESAVIVKIVRFKNSFENMKKWIQSDDLTKYTYCDVKLNVIVEGSGISSSSNNSTAKLEKYQIIGEIQFIIDFMRKAKDKGHKFYSIVRNKEYFEALNNRIEHEMCATELNKIIIDQNYRSLSQEILFGSLENADNKILTDLIKLSSDRKHPWKKGKKLLQAKYDNKFDVTEKKENDNENLPNGSTTGDAQ